MSFNCFKGYKTSSKFILIFSLIFSLTLLCLSITHYIFYKKIDIPDNKACFPDYFSRSFINVINESNQNKTKDDYIYYSPLIDIAGASDEYFVNVDIVNINKPFVFNIEQSDDNLNWINIDNNIIESKGTKKITGKIDKRYIRLKIIIKPESIILINTFELTIPTVNQRNRKNIIETTMTGTMITMIILSFIIFCIFVFSMVDLLKLEQKCYE
jgi:hypothetical protein